MCPPGCSLPEALGARLGGVVGVAPRWCWDLQEELGGLDLWKKGSAKERKGGHGGGVLLV